MSRHDPIEGLRSQIRELQIGFERLAQNQIAPSQALKDWFWLHKWKILSGVAGTAVGLSFIAAFAAPYVESAWNRWADARIDAKLSAPLNDIRSTRDDVKEIKGKLTAWEPLVDGLLRERLARAASLTQKEFQRSLPELQSLLSLATERYITIDPIPIRRIGRKLLNVKPRVPEFWPASGQFVSYRSITQASPTIRQLDPAKLKDCTDAPPAPMKITKVISPEKAEYSKALYENCRVTLDSDKDTDRINSVLLSQFPFLKFKNCMVVYRGGVVHLVLEWHGEVGALHVEGWSASAPTTLSGRTIEFENCLFDFSIQGAPPPSGKETTETLLAQDSPTVRLPRP